MVQSLAKVIIHIVFGTKSRMPYLRPETLAKLVETLKRTSSKWIKTKSPDLEFFAWQNGYAVFSVSPTNIETVRAYVRGQEQHHQKSTFQGEFLALLKGSNTQFDPNYLWD